MKYLLALVLFASVLAGCTTYAIDSRDTSENFYPPKTSIDDVKYMEKIDQPYEEIGVVIVTTERRQGLEDVIPKLKQEAAILGGDVITDIQSDAGGTWQRIKPPFSKLLSNAYLRSRFSAKVLILK